MPEVHAAAHLRIVSQQLGIVPDEILGHQLRESDLGRLAARVEDAVHAIIVSER